MRRFRSNFGQSCPKSENRHGIRGWTSNLGQGSGRQKAISSNPERFEQPPEFRANRPNSEQTARISSKCSIRDKREFRATHPNFEQTIRISSKPRRSFEHFERFERDPPETPDGLELAPNSGSGDFGPKKHTQDAFGIFRAASGDLRGFPRKVNVLYGDFRLSRPFLTTHME